jgi:hypothetical protein
MRGFEINVLEDPLPGKYAHSAGLKLAGQNSLIHPDLLKPGIKVRLERFAERHIRHYAF